MNLKYGQLFYGKCLYQIEFNLSILPNFISPTQGAILKLFNNAS